MARSLSLSNIYLSKTTSSSASRLFTLRSSSNLPNHTDFTDDSSSSSPTDPLLRTLEDAIHRMIVRRSAPDWLPFLPGSSYWVPPPRSATTSLGIAQLVEKLVNPLTDEQNLSTTTVRGWPSADFFIKGLPTQPVEVEKISDELKAKPTSSDVPNSEDEEG